MAVVDVEHYPHFNIGSDDMSAMSIRMIRNSESMINASITVNSLSSLIVSKAHVPAPATIRNFLNYISDSIL